MDFSTQQQQVESLVNQLYPLVAGKHPSISMSAVLYVLTALILTDMHPDDYDVLIDEIIVRLKQNLRDIQLQRKG